VLIDVGRASVRTITHSQGDTRIRSFESKERFVLSGGTFQSPDFFTTFGGFELTGGTLVNTRAGLITIGPGGGRLVNAGASLTFSSGAGPVVINKGLSLNTATLTSGATIRFEGSQQLNGWGSLWFTNGGRMFIDGGTTLTTFEGMTLIGASDTVGTRTPGTNGPATLVNKGRIFPRGGSLVLDADVLANSGWIKAAFGGDIVVNGSAFSSTGQLESEAGNRMEIHAPFNAGGTIGGSGPVRAHAGLNVHVKVTNSGTGALRVAGSLSLSDGAVLDFQGGNVVNDYNGSSPIKRIRQYLASGYNGGAWNGPGIRSSGILAVGYAEASSLFTTFPATFASEVIDDTTILLRLARYGDADLNGMVNLNDFNRLAVNFGATDAFWHTGDFNYDMLVNLQDFNRLAGNFGLSAGPDGPTPQDWANLASAVPEPHFTLAGVFYIAWMFIRCRRR
jgi:hypothetical protein